MSEAQYESVERPATRSRGGADDEAKNRFYTALIATADTGAALRVPFNGTAPVVLRNRWIMALKRRGYRLHAQLSPDRQAFMAWAIKREVK